MSLLMIESGWIGSVVKLNLSEDDMIENQCQGCQAGWKTEAHNPWPKGSKPMVFHFVEGGYKGERVICTKDKYRTTRTSE